MTQRLVGLAAHHWAMFDGWAASRPLDPLDLTIDRFLSLVYFWAVKDAESEQARGKFDARLWLPPPGAVPTSGPWSPEAETAAFKSLSAAVNAK